MLALYVYLQKNYFFIKIKIKRKNLFAPQLKIYHWSVNHDILNIRKIKESNEKIY
jgi:hypothetical protein